MAYELQDLTVHEVSSVDNGAGKGVKVELIKRRGGADVGEDGLYPSTLLKRDWSDEERHDAEQRGAAMPGGGYPIDNKEDLHDAMEAIGRAKDPSKVKAHIRQRARALGLTGELSDAFKVKSPGLFAKVLHALGVAKAIDFDEAQANAEAEEFASGMIDEFQEAICSLKDAVCSVINDPAVNDKDAALKELFSQFVEHVGGVVPEGIEQAMSAAGLTAAGYELTPQGTLTKRGDTMTEAERKAMDEEKAKREKAEKRLDAVLKMSDAHQAFMTHPKAKMPEGGKEAFADMSPAERDEHMSKNPIEKAKAEEDEDDEKRTEKRLMEIVGKAMIPFQSEIAKLKGENDELRKANDLVGFTKRATEAGLPSGAGETLMKAYAGDKGAVDTLITTIKGLTAQVDTGSLFKTFGTSNGGDATSAVAEVTAKAAELRKSDPKLSATQARVKVLESDQPLMKRYRAETENNRAA